LTAALDDTAYRRREAARRETPKHGDHEHEHDDRDSRYSSDGTSFVARAVEDARCDGNAVTFEAVGQVVDGQPVVTVTEVAGDRR
jgi:hypothetical protein